ncbi:hypothetical protein [Undibacterium crateris]|uniref:hypothetical protein n=1 Tax=Undibacterium crateris TaxID=2528175 RepID=UPI00138A5081|nr:hypothetical protein [Undibacterium crateris]NDI85059.1 hypothetical protein [Undibacterium crateris]
MNITLQNGSVLPGDMVISAVLRTDLSPVPASLEVTLRGSEEIDKQAVEGNFLIAGSYNYEFQIIKVEKSNDVAGAQGKDVYPPLSITALYRPCHKISFRRSSAVIKEGATLGEVYGACGASVRIESDFSIKKFSCFIGGVPSYHIAVSLQEEGGAVFLDKGSVRFLRLEDLFKQKSSITISEDAAQEIASGFLERHEIPFFYSLDEQGKFVFGNKSKVRAAQYQPRTDSRLLRNLSKAIVTRKIARLDFSPSINAGSIITVGKNDYVVITAAHAFISGTDGEGVDTYSKFWLGTLEG